jgi:hypothetical protein
MLHTTLKLCKEHYTCSNGLKKLKNSLGKDHSDTDLIPLTHVLKSIGLFDTLWVLRATVEDSSYVAREFAIFCARQSLPFYEDKYPDDSRVRDGIDAAERYNNKEITLEELVVFNKAARKAAWASWTACTTRSASTAWDAAAASAAWDAATASASWAAAAWTSVGSFDVVSKEEQSIKLTELLNNHEAS